MRQEGSTNANQCTKPAEGHVKKVEHGGVNSEVTIELQGGIEIVSIITKQSAEKLQITKDRAVYAVIKASDVMIAKD
jgi:molybdopterin-binding protein